MSAVAAGEWVEIEQVVLTPEQRAPNLPADTAQLPYVVRVSGFLVAAAELGGPARVRTRSGRELAGTLRVRNPGYTHSFGETVRELLDIGAGDRTG
jgi:hypothetical protein